MRTSYLLQMSLAHVNICMIRATCTQGRVGYLFCLSQMVILEVEPFVQWDREILIRYYPNSETAISLSLTSKLHCHIRLTLLSYGNIVSSLLSFTRQRGCLCLFLLPSFQFRTRCSIIWKPRAVRAKPGSKKCTEAPFKSGMGRLTWF